MDGGRGGWRREGWMEGGMEGGRDGGGRERKTDGESEKDIEK